MGHVCCGGIFDFGGLNSALGVRRFSSGEVGSVS